MNNKSILVLRGKNNTDDEISAFNTAKANLIDGQPLFDKKNNYLYIGNKDDSSSIKPITSDRIKGDGYSIAIGSASPRNLEINTTSNIKMQAGSGSSNPLVIETSYTDNLVKIKKSNDDTTKSTALLGVGFIHLPDIDGAPINTDLPKVIGVNGIIRSINGLAVGDDTFLFDCDTLGTLALMLNGGDRALTAIRFYGLYNNSNIPINDPSQGLPHGNIIFTENSRFKVDLITDIHRRCDIYSTSASGENQVNVMMPSKDPLHPDDSGAYNIRLFYNTDGRRGLYDRKLDSTFILINGNDSVKFTGNLDGNATTATTAAKLSTTNIGSLYEPCYFANGIPVKCSTTPKTRVTVFNDLSRGSRDTVISDVAIGLMGFESTIFYDADATNNYISFRINASSNNNKYWYAVITGGDTYRSGKIPFQGVAYAGVAQAGNYQLNLGYNDTLSTPVTFTKLYGTSKGASILIVYGRFE